MKTFKALLASTIIFIVLNWLFTIIGWIDLFDESILGLALVIAIIGGAVVYYSKTPTS